MGKPQIFVFIELKENKIYENTYASLTMARGIVKATIDSNKENVRWACIWDVNKVYYEIISDDYCETLQILHDLNLGGKVTKAIPKKELAEISVNNPKLFDKYLDYIAETQKNNKFFSIRDKFS
tara:strand:- start:1012 stop:1383 length:372 start_codon:yes stop_codon:yes gene_type:complete